MVMGQASLCVAEAKLKEIGISVHNARELVARQSIDLICAH